jgi:hypothetical protein
MAPDTGTYFPNNSIGGTGGITSPTIVFNNMALMVVINLIKCPDPVVAVQMADTEGQLLKLGI